jgi:hypothetical protein
MKEYRARKTIYLEQCSDVIPYHDRNKRTCDIAPQKSAVRNICNTAAKIKSSNATTTSKQDQRYWTK